MLWYSYIRTDKKGAHNRPYIIIHNENTRECIIIDVAIQVCKNMVKKEAKKIIKYRDLEKEIQNVGTSNIYVQYR